MKMKVVQKTENTSKFKRIYHKVAKTCIATVTAFKLGFLESQMACNAAGLKTPKIEVNTNANAADIMGKVVGLIFSIFQLVGLLLSVWGLSQIIMGFKDDNPDSKTKGVTFMLVGVLLMCLQALAKSIDLIK